jgi:hypothetical protein
MAMDINDFGLHHEAFGFGDTDYSQMANSNTEFLNLFGIGESPKSKSLKKEYFARIDALPVSDKAGRDALFAELESKLVALNAPSSEVEDVEKAKRKAERGQKILSGIEKGLDIFGKATELLGIGRRVEGEGAPQQSGSPSPRSGGSQGGGGGSQGGGRSTSANKVPTWVWIAGGAVVLGLGVFAIYKFRK